MSEPNGLNFYFENPQPINDSELSEFPNRFQGKYLNVDSSSVTIGDKFMLSERDFKFKIHKKDLDSIKDTYEFIGGKLIETATHKPVESKFIGDSLQISEKWLDTIFYFSSENKVKRINGNLVLNNKDSIFWKIKILSLEKDVLKFNYFYSEEDLKSLDSITKIKAKMIDSSSYVFKPTRKEFKNILRLKNLKGIEAFKKASK